MCDQKIQTDDIRFPVCLLHRGSMHRAYLFDVDGKVVRDDVGQPLSLYSKNITDYVKNSRIRFIYNLPKEYRFIVTSRAQYLRFKYEQKHGSLVPRRQYHVYYDSDAAPRSIFKYWWETNKIKAVDR